MANWFSVSDQAGEPEGYINEHNTVPFAVVRYGTGPNMTSEDPAWCRRVAAAWSDAAGLLEAAQARAKETADGK